MDGPLREFSRYHWTSPQERDVHLFCRHAAEDDVGGRPEDRASSKRRKRHHEGHDDTLAISRQSQSAVVNHDS